MHNFLVFEWINVSESQVCVNKSPILLLLLCKSVPTASYLICSLQSI